MAAREKSPVRTAWSAARIVALSSLFTCANGTPLPPITAASDIETCNEQRERLRNAMIFVLPLNPNFQENAVSE
ncbi:MAG TPA: hypothetical protein VKP67_17085 [Xanthobacteraceae bacterium]|nr:hypothetical protein [Xanthobacteraceae bacterium]